MAPTDTFTKLGAVNHILGNLGEYPVASLTPPYSLAVQDALSTIDRVLATTLQRGWSWNTETLMLTPDENGHIEIGPEYLTVTSAVPADYALSLRGGRLYRIKPYASGDTWDGDVPVIVRINLDFDDLPPQARTYVTLKASRHLQLRDQGDPQTLRDNADEEQRAWATLLQNETDMGRLSLHQSPHVFGITNPLHTRRR